MVWLRTLAVSSSAVLAPPRTQAPIAAIPIVAVAAVATRLPPLPSAALAAPPRWPPSSFLPAFTQRPPF